ncbi:isoleucyl-tRNA synthetase, putative [Eimeria praecox]|uniref:isoleucine--tRNA ligase n=1 Tax=Eimeria praecox TaxID=51316 RepID=U6GEJ3_9EIME|nr:isoleucyl-tRNA synthetase, putative [Eimeria praecox]
MGLRGRSSQLRVAEGPFCTSIADQQHHDNPHPGFQRRRSGRLFAELSLLLLFLSFPLSVSASSLLARLPLAHGAADKFTFAAGAGYHKASPLGWHGVRIGGIVQRSDVERSPSGFLSPKWIENACDSKATCERSPSCLRLASSTSNAKDADSPPSHTHKGASSSKASSKDINNSHVFSSTVLLPRSSLLLRGSTWKSELAVQRLWQRHDTYKQLLLQIWCLNKCLQQLKDQQNTYMRSKRRCSPSDEILDSLGFAVAPPATSNGSSGSTMLLLDGPPYANGEPHMGHAVNKCLKDFAVRAALLQRRCCHMLPGWDCHGLPIELRAATAATAVTKHNASAQAAKAGTAETTGVAKVTPNTGGTIAIDCNSSGNVAGKSDNATGFRCRDGSEELRNRARQVALHFASLQQKAFQREVVLKPTARDHLYFKLLLTGPRPLSEGGEAFPIEKEIPWFFVAWTTTPFTIPANRALAVSASTHYAVLRASQKGRQYGDDEIWIVGEKCVASLLEALQGAGELWNVHQIGTIPGSQLEGLRYAHPVASRVTCPVLLDPVVEEDKGTSILHVAPAHSQEDYRLCLSALNQRLASSDGILLTCLSQRGPFCRTASQSGKQSGDEAAATALGAPLLCPVGPQGTFLGGSGSEPFKGLEALNGGEQCIIEYLRSSKALLLNQKVVLPFPHDERRGCPLLLRATPQLHFKVQELLPEVFRDLRRIRWLPHRRNPAQQQKHHSGSSIELHGLMQAQEEQCKTAPTATDPATGAAPGYERMRAALHTRPPTWCLSRQRQWGLPIPLVEQHEVGRDVSHCRRAHTPGLTAEERWTNLRLDNDFWLYAESSEVANDEREGLLTKLRRRKWCEATFDVWFDAASAWLRGHKFVQQWTGDASNFLKRYIPQLQQKQWQPQVEHHQYGQDLRAHQREGPQSSQKAKELLHEGEPEKYSCLVVEGSDQSRGWFQSLLLSHAGAREGLRRERSQLLKPGALNPVGQKSRQGAAVPMEGANGTTAHAKTSRGELQQAAEGLDDARLPELPFNVVVTHGFVVDSSGNKLSKSKGNALSPDLFFAAEKDAAAAPGKKPPHAHSGSSAQPQQLHRVRKQRKVAQQAYGADVLRLFVGALDFGGDMECPSGDSKQQQQDRNTVVDAASATYIKFRNAFKYLIGSLQDFDIKAEAVALNELPLFDIGMLLRLQVLADDVGKSYEAFQHNKALRLLLRFISEDLSATYIEVAKDRLYLDHPRGYRRRSCQTVLLMVLLVLTQLVSPLTPHLAEEVFFRMPRTFRKTLAAHRSSKILKILGPGGQGFANALGLCGPLTSVFQVGWPRMQLSIQPTTAAEAEQLWDLVALLRKDVHCLFTKARQLRSCSNAGEPRIGSLNDLKLSITAPTRTMFDHLQRLLPRAKLLRPGPLPPPLTGQKEAVGEMRSYVDDLRWLVQCSDVEIHMVRAPWETPNIEQLANETLLASIERSASNSGLNMKLYRAQGPRCQRCWMRDVPSTGDVSGTQGPGTQQGSADASQQAEANASAGKKAAGGVTLEAPYACERCTDAMRHIQSKV